MCWGLPQSFLHARQMFLPTDLHPSTICVFGAEVTGMVTSMCSREEHIQIMDVMGARAMYLPGDDGQGTESLQSPDLQKTEAAKPSRETAVLPCLSLARNDEAFAVPGTQKCHLSASCSWRYITTACAGTNHFANWNANEVGGPEQEWWQLR